MVNTGFSGSSIGAPVLPVFRASWGVSALSWPPHPTAHCGTHIANELVSGSSFSPALTSFWQLYKLCWISLAVACPTLATLVL
eukprot:3241374-Prymnesium_polylepis.1